MRIRYSSQQLLEFSAALFIAAGLARERAEVMASVFVEADLLGFTTHGVNCVARNLGWLEDRVTRKDGDPVVLADRGNVFNWDAEFLPGPWVVSQAIDQCINRIGERGLVCATIRRSHHIACLGAYLPRIAEANSVFIQVIDPEACTSRRNYQRQIQAFKKLADESRPDSAHVDVRLPGKNAWLHRSNNCKPVSSYIQP